LETPIAAPRTPGLVTAPYKVISGKLTRFLARNGVLAGDRHTGAADIAERVAAPSRCPIIGQLTKLQCEGAPLAACRARPSGQKCN